MVLGGVVPDRPLIQILVIVVATAIVWVGSGWLEESAEHLSAYYGLPPVVQGSVVVAVGSSFPELASVIIAALAGTFSMGIGAIVGSAIFNILVIPSISRLTSDDDLDSNRTVVYKEAQFYMIAVATIVLTFALAVIYWPAPTGQPLTGQLTRPLATLPLLLYGLYLFIQWQDVSDHVAVEKPTVRSVRTEWARLAAGLLLIVIAVELLVGSILSLGATFGVPEFLAGATILAAATSLPDLLVSVRSAASGNDITSLGNVLGSNTFDLLVAIPAGVLIAGSMPVDFAVAVPMFGVLTFATILLFTLLRTDLQITAVEAYALLGCYLVFVAWIVAETIGVTAFIKGS